MISPETSAGLGDFRREADLLNEAGLCEFHFFQATFQGVEAPSSIQGAVLKALAAHKTGAFDLLVVIRGGGAVTDLAWLNDFDLAKLLSQSGIPVYTGIGHERDSTILDEIAYVRFDTPSKVALHISSTIKDNALVAMQAWERITVLVRRIMLRERTMLATQADRVEIGVATLVSRVASDQDGLARLIHTAITAQFREAAITLEAQQERVIQGAEKAMNDSKLGVARLLESVTQQAQIQLETERSELERLAQSVRLQWENWLDAVERDLVQTKSHVEWDTDRMMSMASDGLDQSISGLVNGASTIAAGAGKDIENCARIVVGLGPQSTLQRGFAIARDDDNKPLTSREAAMNNASFQVQFRDGSVAVKNIDRAGG